MRTPVTGSISLFTDLGLVIVPTLKVDLGWTILGDMRSGPFLQEIRKNESLIQLSRAVAKKFE